MWRKRREKCRFGMFRARRRGCGINCVPSPCFSLKTQIQKKRRRLLTYNSQDSTSVLGCGSEMSENTLEQQSSPLNKCESAVLSGMPSQDTVMDTDVAAGVGGQIILKGVEPETCSKINHLSELSDVVKPVSADRNGCRLIRDRNPGEPAKRLELDVPSGQYHAVCPDQNQVSEGDEEQVTTKRTGSLQTDIGLKEVAKDIHEFLDDFYRIYGSFIPLQKNDILKHLKRRFDVDFNDRTNFIFSEVTKYRISMVNKPIPSFRVVYKKHTLTLDDLSTLANQNWLNDQVMNMYGELIMESAHHKVHFLNSFFHRQLMTKGYDGVKRWTKQVDLFSKTLLLVPVHLEVHWCLVTADIPQKKICLYDSQGNALQKVARNILRYLITEAKEKRRSAFENDWTVSFDEKIPQQTNENDCGVFVLEYSRCLALTKPLQFSQKDIPNIRKRIYKELCDCKLHEQD
ncbi:sentrin-specific protease 5-like [Sphaeramia orbicularis]|uniref:sentrin-specific protease 5-like n=1 Tax=Sphaeramia orbicularis TaxID=375764 RepID=UPI0011805CA0|nr:sentrin-specific protease 5-like [Sphaeramia orbicularis]XP_030015999.1 sentrin-specific protease 5-like [Sphaeramia orbicularis]